MDTLEYINPFKPSIPLKGLWQTVKTQFRMWRLIRNSDSEILQNMIIIKTIKADSPYIGNGPVLRVKVEESTRHKWDDDQQWPLLDYIVMLADMTGSIPEGTFPHAVAF